MKLAMVQLLPLKSKQETMEKAEAYIRQAVAGKAEIVVLPEGFCSIFSAQTLHEDAERVGGAVWTRKMCIRDRLCRGFLHVLSACAAFNRNGGDHGGGQHQETTDPVLRAENILI